MNANELRIGNWVMGEPLLIPRMGIQSNGWISLTAYGIMVISEGTMKAEPIPLTPELLRKCGFTDKEDDGYPLSKTHGQEWELKAHRSNASRSMTIHEVADGYRLIGFYGRTFHHLHQLQNLYFALCGQELQINL